jgi:putative acyl-CoA dehydrogenase
MSIKAQFATHAVQNQPLPLPPVNLWTSDACLREAVQRHGGAWAQSQLHAHGELAGGPMMELGELANRNRPVLRAFDRHGRRIDAVEFHPAYHELMQHAMRSEVHSFSWRHGDQRGAHVARAALMYVNTQPDAGIACPLTMTHAAVPALRQTGAHAEPWLKLVTAADYDPRTLPAAQKSAATVGMGMTEKQGGSDVRSNTTRAIAQPGGSYELVGHKFFFSAPMSDAHLVLAQSDAGLSCFLLPRVLPDGQLNAVRIQRLKDKLGDWSNASAEVEFQGATAYLVGPEGRGVPTIIEMVALTRLDCMLGSAALMRQALVQAVHHARQRQAFGRLLIDQPLMANVLADLALDSEAAVRLCMRVAQAVDQAPGDAHEAAIVRLATAIGKYWICKRTPAFVNEAQECLGGIGYVEENILPRLYRQAPLNSIWEGSGNIQCLDVLRALQKEPGVREALFRELAVARGTDPHYDRSVDWLASAFDDTANLESRSRLLVERTALTLQAALLLSAGNGDVSHAFCVARLGDARGIAYGTLAAQTPMSRVIERAVPVF